MDSIPLAPYYAPAEELPASLPTQQAIEAATEILSTIRSTTVGLGPHFIAKYGRRLSLEEGRTQMFVRQATSVPVAKVYAFFHDPENLKNYIIMERIPAASLDKTWTSLTLAQKQVVTAQLKAYFTELRKLPSPGGYCSLDRKPLRSDFFWSEPGEMTRGLDGPFNSESELNESFLQHYRSSPTWTDAKVDFHARALPTILKDHPPTFTHGDVQLKNILFDLRSEKVTLIDWEDAGWYPSYWDYVITTYGTTRCDDDWLERLESILGVYRNEFAWVRLMIEELWGC